MMTRNALIPSVALLAACAGSHHRSLPEPVGPCESLFASLDEAVESASVRWSRAAPIDGFPYLRSSRFLASYRTEDLGSAQWDAWVAALRALDRRGRAIELERIEASARQRLGLDNLATAGVLLDECAETLAERDLAKETRRKALRAAAQVDDDYVMGRRILGLYPLTAIPVAEGIRRLHNDVKAVYARPLDALPLRGELMRFGPIAVAVDTAPAPSDYGDGLGVPRPTGEALAALYAAHAPVWEIDVSGAFDRPGRPRWDPRGYPSVDVSDPVVYQFESWTRWRGEALLQLNYLVWFAERPSEGRYDLLAGPLDGVIWRVTLDAEGRPLVYDAVHACGCYHLFFPANRVRLRRMPETLPEPPLAPQTAPSLHPGRRLAVRLSSRQHYVQRVTLVSEDAWAPYRLDHYDALYTLPWTDGARRGPFDSDGLIAGSDRPERYLLWPMGILSPGAMRGWGRHPIAFVGRRHLDDPDLVERFFEPVTPP